jgi:hypothetical protein
LGSGGDARRKSADCGLVARRMFANEQKRSENSVLCLLSSPVWPALCQGSPDFLARSCCWMSDFEHNAFVCAKNNMTRRSNLPLRKQF